MAKNLTPDQGSRLAGNAGVRVETCPQAAVRWFSYNQKTESLTNPALWRAACERVDDEGMADSFLEGQTKVNQAFRPEGFPGTLTAPLHLRPRANHAASRRRRVELPITVPLDVIDAAPFNDIAASLQQTFAPAGINFEMLQRTGARVATKCQARTHLAMLLCRGPDVMDPKWNAKAFAFDADNGGVQYVSAAAWRIAGMPAAEITAETMAALAEQDPSRCDQMYPELQTAIRDEARFVIMFWAVKQVAMAQDATGLVNSATSDFGQDRLVEKK